MFTKGNKIYADTGYYLKNKINSSIALTKIGDANEWEELPLNDPLDIVVEGNNIFFQNRRFLFKVSKIDYATIKTRIIMSRYSNDDQMALILNNGSTEYDTLLYNKMQEWREWAGAIAKQVTEGNY